MARDHISLEYYCTQQIWNGEHLVEKKAKPAIWVGGMASLHCQSQQHQLPWVSVSLGMLKRADGPFLCARPKLTLYWKSTMPQNRLKRSAVSSERFTAVALVIFTTTGMKLYRPYMHSTYARNSMPVENHSAGYQCSQIKTLFIPERC